MNATAAALFDTVMVVIVGAVGTGRRLMVHAAPSVTPGRSVTRANVVHRGAVT